MKAAEMLCSFCVPSMFLHDVVRKIRAC